MVLTLTTESGLSIALDDSNIVYVQASGVSNSIVTFYNFGNALEKITVTSTPAAIASASGAVMSVTQYVTGYSGTTQTTYINALKCSRSITDFTSYRAIQYNEFGNSWKPIYVTDSLANLVAAINVTSSPEVTIAGAQTITGQKTFSAAVLVSAVTDATTKDTGSIITEGGIGVEKAIVTGTGITAGTSLTSTTTTIVGTALSVGTDQSFAKEVNHSVAVTASTTATAVGGNLALSAGTGATSGAGGTASVQGGEGGATGAGGVATLQSGRGGATSGASGAVNVKSGTATVGASGTITVQSGNTASGVAGDVVIDTGLGTSTTVCPVVSLNKGVVRKPASSSVASGATITGVELVKGLIAATGATGNWQLPATADITTAIGSTPAGTYFDFVFNAAAMTPTNTATLVVGANMSVMSAAPVTGGDTLTVTQDTQVVGHFRITYDTATTCKISRIA